MSRARRITLPVSIDSISQMYGRGMSVAAIAREIGMKSSTLYGLLRRQGFQFREQPKSVARGCHHYKWKGGKTVNSQGYVMHYSGKHAGKLDHRVIAEKMIGRKLHANEVIHHVNGITNDNRHQNLQVLTRSEHTRLHRKQELAAGMSLFGRRSKC